MPDIQSNLWKVYLYRFISDFWLIAPILVPFYESNGLSATQVFVVQAVYAASVLVFEIPSGYLADVIGRKQTLVLGSLALPIGLFIYAFSYSFVGFVLAEVILGIAGSMRSGTDSALIYDTLIETQQESEYKKFEGTAEFFHQAAHAVSSIMGGLFALTSLRYPFYINIASGLLLFPLALTLSEPERKKARADDPLKEIIDISGYCMTNPQIRSIILFSSLMLGSGITGVWSYYMYYAELGLSVGLYGILFAAFGLVSGLASSQAHFIEKRLGRAKSLSALLLIAPVFFCLGAFTSAALIPFILLNAFLWGFSSPLFRDYINELIESDIRATVLSVSGMIGSLAFVVLSPIFGKLVDVFSLSIAHMTLGVFFLLSGLYCLLLLRRNRVI